MSFRGLRSISLGEPFATQMHALPPEDSPFYIPLSVLLFTKLVGCLIEGDKVVIPAALLREAAR